MQQIDVVQTAVGTWRVAPPPVSAGELVVWLKHGTVRRAEEEWWLPEAPKIMAHEVAFLIASVLETPLVRGSVKLGLQAGRFAMVEYQPRGRSDPTVVMTTAPGARRYHIAALQFSRLASRVVSGWSRYDDMRVAGRRVAAELAQLQPCLEEAKLVMNWLLDRITYGEPR